MSLYIKCDLCGEFSMHPGDIKDTVYEEKGNKTTVDLDNWLMTDNYDICFNCLRDKLDAVEMIANRYVLKDEFKTDDLEKVVEEKIKEKGV